MLSNQCSVPKPRMIFKYEFTNFKYIQALDNDNVAYLNI